MIIHLDRNSHGFTKGENNNTTMCGELLVKGVCDGTLDFYTSDNNKSRFLGAISNKLPRIEKTEKLCLDCINIFHLKNITL